ncbi:MAG: FxDxF family PEP-CTERM protein [Myxococcota bacterium]
MRQFWSFGSGARWALGLAVLLTGLGALAPAARANDVNNDIVLSGGTNFFGALHTDDADFTDTFTFTIDGAVSANVSLVTIGEGASNIDFLSADLNGIALTLDPNGFFESGFLGTTDFTGPLVLTVSGRSGATGGVFASYSGTINVTIIPEPSTSLLMGLGLGGLAFASRRARV